MMLMLMLMAGQMAGQMAGWMDGWLKAERWLTDNMAGAGCSTRGRLLSSLVLSCLCLQNHTLARSILCYASKDRLRSHPIPR
jgi:hypothetical protein